MTEVKKNRKMICLQMQTKLHAMGKLKELEMLYNMEEICAYFENRWTFEQLPLSVSLFVLYYTDADNKRLLLELITFDIVNSNSWPL